MTVSVWGVDHGYVVSKWDKNQTYAGLTSNITGAIQAKKGKKVKVYLKGIGRGTLEAAGGGIAGHAAGLGVAALTRNKIHPDTARVVGSDVGRVVGAFHGIGASHGNSRRLGYVKKK